MKVAIIQFPGTNCDYDSLHVLQNVLKVDASIFWYNSDGLEKFDAIIIPGGFSYGDHLRSGIIAAKSNIINNIRDFANTGKPVLGICNGFQVLVESELLPGALLPNSSTKFTCKWVNLKVENNSTIFTSIFEKNSVIKMPVAHHEGRFFGDQSLLNDMNNNHQIVFRYTDSDGNITDNSNPNGSVENIAGVCNRAGNVMGLMPHPERASEQILSPFNSDHGLQLFSSMLRSIEVIKKNE
ncbi:MAG: phosphoribosylformylglycinamidine synthase I [Thermoproteota archaeon]